MNAEYIGEKSIAIVGFAHAVDRGASPTLPSVPKPLLDVPFDELHAAKPTPATTTPPARPRATTVERERDFIAITAFDRG
jgi:hypothetical protein